MTKRFPDWAGVVLWAFGISGFFHLLQSDVHLNWADEGFLWYGVIHTKLGQVPVRDFQSYDPLRYYWCVAWMRVFGDGLMGFRHSEWLFQATGLSCGLLALRRVLKNDGELFVAAVLIILWQLWDIRYFDSCYPMIAVFFAVRLLERPSFKRHFVAGLLAGFSFFMGLNHALYLLAAFYLLMVFADIKGAVEEPSKKRLVFFTGALLGTMPIVLMAVAVPGFWERYCERFLWFGQMLAHGATDIRRSIEWPWMVHWQDIVRANPDFWTALVQYLNLWAQGAAFITLIVFYAAAFFAVIRIKKEEIARQPLLIAGFFVGMAYLNHVFARSDVTHLGEGMFPIIAGVCVFASGARWIRRPWMRQMLTGWLLLLTLLGALPLNKLFFKALAPRRIMTPYAVGKDWLWVFKTEARQADRFKELVRQYVPSNETIFIAPMLPTLYCLLAKTSPTYQIYFLVAEPEKIQERQIRELEDKKVNWALIGDLALDGREELRFSNTHTLLWNYLAKNFEALPVDGLPPRHVLLRRSTLPEGGIRS